MPIVHLNGAALAYDATGPLDGSRPVVVLAHGLACGRRMWDGLTAALADRHTVVAYDLRGHGQSAAPPDRDQYSESLLAADLVALIDLLGVGPVALVGLSMGGGVALDAALARPGLVSALVLADVGSGSDNAAAVQRRAENWALLVEERGIGAFADEMMRSNFLRDYVLQSPTAKAHMRGLILEHTPAGIAGVLRGVLARRRSIFRKGHKLRGLALPVLVVVGQRDFACTKPSRFLAANLPDVEYHRLRGIGHMTALEAPSEFAGLVGAFLARRRPAQPTVML